MSSNGEAMEEGDLSLAYANGAFIPQGEDYPRRWAGQAATFRTTAAPRARLGLRYGPRERNLLDLFLPDETARGVIVFLHGGYWMGSGREDWSHLAAGPLARGWAVALPSYTLAPDIPIAGITREVAAAVESAAALVAGPVVLTGHSAGGHLAARLACEDAPLSADTAGRLVRSVPISPLADLAPLRRTTMNATLAIDEAEAASESPARLLRRASTAVIVHVGGQERPAFLWQARLLSEAWSCPWHVEPGRHHFDVIDALVDPGSRLVSDLLGS